MAHMNKDLYIQTVGNYITAGLIWTVDFNTKDIHIELAFSNLKIKSINKDDGLILRNMYLTTALKCVPPGDKPTSKELKTCFNYFNKEIGYLKNVSVIVALGKIGYDACLNYYKQYYQIKNKDFIFSHGSKNILPDNKLLVGSYHPSPCLLYTSDAADE